VAASPQTKPINLSCDSKIKHTGHLSVGTLHYPCTIHKKLWWFQCWASNLFIFTGNAYFWIISASNFKSSCGQQRSQ